MVPARAKWVRGLTDWIELCIESPVERFDRNLDDVTTITLSYTFFNANPDTTPARQRTTQADRPRPVSVN